MKATFARGEGPISMQHDSKICSRLQFEHKQQNSTQQHTTNMHPPWCLCTHRLHATHEGKGPRTIGAHPFIWTIVSWSVHSSEFIFGWFVRWAAFIRDVCRVPLSSSPWPDLELGPSSYRWGQASSRSSRSFCIGHDPALPNVPS